MKTTNKKLKFDAYDYTVHVTFAADIQKYCANKWPDKNPAEVCVAYTLVGDRYKNENWSHLVFAPDVSPDTIAHEASHAIWGIMQYIGAAFEDEVFAYHIGHLVGRIHGWQKDIKKANERKLQSETKDTIHVSMVSKKDSDAEKSS